MWYQLQVEQFSPDELSLLSNDLEEKGALSVTVADKNGVAVIEPEAGAPIVWPNMLLTALYSEQQSAEKAQTYLTTTYPHLHSSIEFLHDKDWERIWMEDFKPKAFGQRLWVCPTWSSPPNPDAINLILDPGLAFGTGNHATTHLCLHWLDATDMTQKKLIDFGCGSGILALAALKLGAAAVHAVDIDVQALQATQSNALINQIIPGQLSTSYPEQLTPEKDAADIVIANILLKPLMELATTFRSLVKKGGMLAVSGLLTEQAETLMNAYAPLFTLEESHEQEGWSLLIFRG